MDYPILQCNKARYFYHKKKRKALAREYVFRGALTAVWWPLLGWQNECASHTLLISMLNISFAHWRGRSAEKRDLHSGSQWSRSTVSVPYQCKMRSEVIVINWKVLFLLFIVSHHFLGLVTTCLVLYSSKFQMQLQSDHRPLKQPEGAE